MMADTVNDTAPVQKPPATPGMAGAALHWALVTLGPILAALLLSGGVLLAAGADPLAYYGLVLQRGLLSWLGLQESLSRMAPLLFLAAGLIVAFRAGIWNLETPAAFYVRVAQNHPSVLFYSTSHNATGYDEDMNPDQIDGVHDPRDTWSANNAKLALRATKRGRS